MDQQRIRIILVDDHQIVRESWKMMLDDNPRFEVVAICKNGFEAISQAEQLLPDIILLDITMSPVNGFDVTYKLRQQLPSIHIIGLSVHTLPSYAQRMMKLGAKGYLTKTSSYQEINHCIVEVFAGREYICEEIVRNTPPKQF